MTAALIEHGCNPQAVGLSDALVWTANREYLQPTDGDEDMDHDATAPSAPTPPR